MVQKPWEGIRRKDASVNLIWGTERPYRVIPLRYALCAAGKLTKKKELPGRALGFIHPPLKGHKTHETKVKLTTTI